MKKNEIEVGDYIRTKEKGIFKIRYIDNSKTINKYLGDNGHDIDNEGDRVYTRIKTTDITKHSKNIVDLIEIGDILILEDECGESVYYIWDNKFIEAIKEDLTNGFFYKIKTILTYEQYEQNCFKVEEIIEEITK